ncbi:alpha-amylase family glycosyl hydrolase [Bowmanella dokdonensis]|uniref:Alpha-glucosidase C-terminal domain-containing protein n=1 Tax=Bowmanella dokdonensis TaxID=751969 RepID=A0A939DNG0_9ALTE|nr:alpha-amylase family glycosyl hydrolase [Bowmanella dokdonensis]MBN7825432.1 alpha-glucosidase C-terminal domain-containing protein [Bowmanella dokdonensis]
MNLTLESRKSLARIKQQLKLDNIKEKDRQLFLSRLDDHFTDLFVLMFELYGHRYDFYFHLQQLINNLLLAHRQRSPALKRLDKQRLSRPDWYQDPGMLGMACYVDLFAGDLKGMLDKIPYLQSLGVTYLHLMPLYDAPKGDSDGGYAVSDYRKVNDELGSMEDLRTLADSLRKAGISLVLDFVFNHTSDEHRWALAAKDGDTEYQDYYYLFDDRSLPDAYEQNLREIFPQVRRGSFTFNEQMDKWVWTTFNSFQWDLNYANPAVFNAICDEMLFLANTGCEALRLDALAFIWKEMGTNCENRPKAHSLIRAFNACLQIAAPAVVFKSEAIVHPDEVVRYIDPGECQLSYNPLLMALLWNSLATRKTRLLTESLQKSFAIHPDCSWVNYVRCHDDIGWTFDDAVAGALGINGYDHRHFLNQFYTGQFEGSFARGVAFGANPSTGDCRVCGSLASLAGLEQALLQQDSLLTDNAVKRILLLHGIILSIGGIPLIYAGDELALLNDYQYRQDDHKAHDDRWVHRIPLTSEGLGQANEQGSPQQRVNRGLLSMIGCRQSHGVFGRAETQILTTNSAHLFAFSRQNEEGERLLVVANFSEAAQELDGRLLDHLAASRAVDLLSARQLHQDQRLILTPYEMLWLVADEPA